MKENFEYWLKWNLITGATGITFVFFSFVFFCIDMKLDLDIFDRIGAYIFISSMLAAFLLIPFISALVLTIIRRDMPFYYYGTVGLLFILCIFGEIYQELFYVRLDQILFVVVLYCLPVIISSLAGGCVMNIFKKL